MAETVVIQSGANPPAEDPAHIQAMIDKVDNQSTSNESLEGVSTEQPVKPEWVPDKFWDADKGVIRTEALAKSYSELETQRGKKEETPPESDPTNATQEQASEELANRGLELESFNSEFQTKGELSPESYEKLEKAGFPRSYVDAYIAGQQALVSQHEADVKSAAGGDEGFEAMVTWAAANADPKEIEAYNRAVESGDPNTAKLAVAGMYQKYLEARPDEPSLVTGKTSSVVEDVYESRAQMTADMANPLYRTDPAFRNKVIQKLARSNIL